MLALTLLLAGAPGLAAEQTSDDAKLLLAGAIQRGAPLYNQGSVEGCAAVYEIAAISLVRFGSDELSVADRELLQATLSVLPSDADGRAWALRRTFDAVLGQGPRPALVGMPEVVAGPEAPTAATGAELPLGGTWGEVDDRVMGGISKGSARVDDDSGHVLWTGRMTTESNGGFVTARTTFDPLDLSEADGLVFRVRGDGRTYKATLNTDGRHSRGIGMALIRTRPGQWVDVRVPFGAFNGRMYGGTRPFDPTRVQSLQLQLSGAEQVGTYTLELASVRAFSE